MTSNPHARSMGVLIDTTAAGVLRSDVTKDTSRSKRPSCGLANVARPSSPSPTGPSSWTFYPDEDPASLRNARTGADLPGHSRIPDGDAAGAATGSASGGATHIQRRALCPRTPAGPVMTDTTA